MRGQGSDFVGDESCSLAGMDAEYQAGAPSVIHVHEDGKASCSLTLEEQEQAIRKVRALIPRRSHVDRRTFFLDCRIGS